jgi:hypothetical protein
MTGEVKGFVIIDADRGLEHIGWLTAVITQRRYELVDESRDYIDTAHLRALLDLYWTLENWGQKCLLVDIVQDKLVMDGADPERDRVIGAVAADVLRAPGEEEDWVYFPKVEALLCLTGVNYFNAPQDEVRAAITHQLDVRGLARAE